MTEEKKNGEIAETSEDKGSGSEMDGGSIKAEEKIEAKSESENGKDSGSENISQDESIEAVEKKGTEDESPVKEAPAEAVEAATAAVDKEKENEEANAEKSGDKPVKDINNLNFYPELRNDIPDIKPGDVLKVYYRVVEGGKERIQIFEGIAIALKNSGITRTVTVRKTSFGVAIERIFPLNSKLVQKIEVVKHSRVRRAKLYYLRKLKGKAARLKELR